MGNRQSRVDQNAPTTGDSDWMSRVEVKPSKQLVARLEQQQRNQRSTMGREINTEAGQAQPEEDGMKPKEERVVGSRSEEENNRASIQEKAENEARKLQAAKRCQVEHLSKTLNDRARELEAVQNAEAARLSKTVNFAPVTKPSGRQQNMCSEEAQAVVKCYQLQRAAGKQLQCSKLVDHLEGCTARVTHTQ